ncbi:hypothetical protein GCM10011363_45650 [Marivita lacus]|uniref:Uncharacterized protein n=1 Tax=Marivita lacus TaxID=1323742 RepID=A0ABQ1LHR7_9RHOB|nr:hypothetical protein GCM10011363_45650 [Marivita lacus]
MILEHSAGACHRGHARSARLGLHGRSPRIACLLESQFDMHIVTKTLMLEQSRAGNTLRWQSRSDL